MSNRKKWEGVVYSTNPDYKHLDSGAFLPQSFLPAKQTLKVQIDKKGRGGKVVTLVTGVEGSEDDLKKLAKKLKIKCGVGGNAKDKEIIIQGEFKNKVFELLTEYGYKVKKS